MKGPFLRKWARSFSPPYVPMRPGLPRGKADEKRWYAIDETMAFAKRAIALDSQSHLHAALDILQWWWLRSLGWYPHGGRKTEWQKRRLPYRTYTIGNRSRLPIKHG